MHIIYRDSFELTYTRLSDPKRFAKFYEGLKEYLKTKLKRAVFAGKEQWQCVDPYHVQGHSFWKPFENLDQYCFDKDFHEEATRLVFEEKAGKELVCECEILNTYDNLHHFSL